MKKLLLTLLMGLLAFSLAACNDDKDKDTKKEATTSDETTKDTKEEAKTEEEIAAEAEEMQKKLDAQKVDEGSVVAIVNGDEVKGNEYNELLSSSQSTYTNAGQDPTTKELAKQLKDYTLESLVGQKLLMQDIDKKGYKATDDEINKELETAKGNFEDDKAFEEALKKTGLSIDQLKEQMADNVKYNKYVAKDLKVEEVKEAEVKEYFDSVVSKMEESAEKPKYDDVKEAIKLQLVQQKTQEKLGSKVEELRKDAKIELKI